MFWKSPAIKIHGLKRTVGRQKEQILRPYESATIKFKFRVSGKRWLLENVAGQGQANFGDDYFVNDSFETGSVPTLGNAE